MATRKQKHKAALAKRERFMVEDKRIGLEAQKRSHEKEKREREEAEKKANDPLRVVTNSMLESLLDKYFIESSRRSTNM